MGPLTPAGGSRRAKLLDSPSRSSWLQSSAGSEHEALQLGEKHRTSSPVTEPDVPGRREDSRRLSLPIVRRRSEPEERRGDLVNPPPRQTPAPGDRLCHPRGYLEDQDGVASAVNFD